MPGGFLIDTPAGPGERHLAASLQLSMAGPRSCGLPPGTGRGVDSAHGSGSTAQRPPNGMGTVLIMRTSIPGAQGVSRNGQVALRLGVRARKLIQVHGQGCAQYLSGSREQGRKVNPFR